MDSHLKELFGQFQQQFGLPAAAHGSSSSGSCLLQIEGISASFIKSLFRAVGILYKSNPWIRYKPNHLFGIRVGKDSDWSGGRQVFSVFQFVGGAAAVAGSGDLLLGFNAFKSEEDESIVSRGVSSSGSQKYMRCAPQKGFIRVVIKSDADATPAYRKMVKDLGLDSILANLGNSLKGIVPVIDVVYSDFNGGLPMFRYPNLDEIRWLYACIKAMVQVHPLLREIDQQQQQGSSRGRGNFEDFVESVDVQWPADDPKAWEIVSVTVSLPPRSYQDHHSFKKHEEAVLEEIDGGGGGVSGGGIIEHVEDDYDYDYDEHCEIPRQCAMCGSEIQQPSKVSRCSRCRAVIYCGQACQKRHWKDGHRSNCELYKAMMDREEELEFHQVFMFPCSIEHSCMWLDSVGLHRKGMWRRFCKCHAQRPFGLLPPIIDNSNGVAGAGAWGLEPSEFPPDSPIVDQDGMQLSSSMIPLSGWVEYYGIRSLPLTSPVAALLTFPLTLYHILSSLSITSKNLLAKGREVVVHYVGPEQELDWIPAFSEISHLLCGSGIVQVFMVGPEVPSILSGTNFAAGSKVNIHLVQGLYQEEARYLPPPQVVVALNAKLEAYSSWIGAVELLKSQGITCYFTDESELSCANAKQILRAAGLFISYPITPNPFRSPVRMQSPSNNLPAFRNGFIFGVNS